jgi:TP901 family phage tail tape measure protein
MANTRAVIDVQINTGQAASALRGLQAQLNSFQSALNTNNRVQASAAKNLSSELSEMVNAGGLFTAESVKMQTAASRLDNTLKKGQGTIGNFWNARFRKDSTQAAAVLSLANARASALETQFVATGGAANGFRNSIAIRPLQAFNSQAAVSAQKLAIHRAMLTQSTTSMINFGKNTQWAGRQLMVGFTVPLTIFAATAGKVFRDIEKEAVNFKKVYGDAFTPPEEMQSNLDAVKDLAKEFTKYGIAVKDTIGLAALAAATGAENADLIDATRESTRLATLGQMDQNQALETTIALQTAFNISGKDLAKTINFLNMVENQTVVTLQDLAAAIPRVAPVIKGLGGSVEDMAVMLAAMREGGVTAAQGANALKSGLASLINPTVKAVSSLEKMGISMNQIVQMNRGDLMGTVQAFGQALSTLDDFSQQQALEQVFGKFQYARLGALFKNIVKDGSQASRVMETAAMSASQLAASADKELGAIEDSSATKFVASMERLKLSIAPIGEMFTEMAIPVLGFLGKLVEKFNELPDFAKKFIGFGSVITGIIIPAGTMFLGLLMNLVGTLIKFGNVVGVAFKGFMSGGIKGAIQAVTQTLGYMSLAEIDAATAAKQLGESTEFVNMALRDQPLAAGAASVAVDELAASYQILALRMMDASKASVAGGAFAVPGAAMARARGGASNLVGRPLPIVARNSGGTIPGTGNRDTVPAVLTPGEFVVNKEATQENLSLLYAINSGKPVSMLNTGGAPVMTAAMQRVLARVQTQRQEAATIPIAMGGRGGTRTTQAANAASSRNSQDLYNTLTGRYQEGQNVRVDTLRFAVERLGFSPEQLGLKTRGNLTFRMSTDSNLAMMRGDLTRDRLLKELETPDVYYPLARQLDSYLGAQLDRNVFDRIYREEILKLPMTGITNGRFEKASRNAVRRYLDSAGFPKGRRNSFIRDILQGDTVNANMSLPAIRQALDARGIKHTPGKDKKDLYVDMDGRQINIGNLAGREAGNLGRPEGVLDYAGLTGSGQAVHANKGGMIPGVQYFGWNPALGILNKRRIVQPKPLKVSESALELLTNQGVLGGTRMATTKTGSKAKPKLRADASAPSPVLGIKNQLFPEKVGSFGMNENNLLKEIARIAGLIDAEKRVLKSSKARTIASAHINKETQMGSKGIEEKVWKAKNIRFTSSLENDALNDIFGSWQRSVVEKPGSGSADLLKRTAPGDIDSLIIKDILNGKHPSSKEEYEVLRSWMQNLMKSEEFNGLGPSNRAKVKLLAAFSDIRLGDRKISRLNDPQGVFTGEVKTLENILKQSVLSKNKGGIIPMLNGGGIAAAANAARGAKGRIPSNIVEWFSKMTTSINQSARDNLLQNIPANIKRGLSTSRKKMDITRGSIDPVGGGDLKEVSSWTTGGGVGRFMESSRLFETLENSKFQIGFRSQGMKKDIDWLKTLGPDGPAPGFAHSPFNKTDGPLNIKLTPQDIEASGGVIWKANKKKLEERIQRDQEFIAGHQRIIDDLQESYVPTIYRTSVKKGEKFFDVSGRIVPRDEQRINNPAASNEILDEKEVALLGARLTGRPKTRIVEREEAQARFDKAKEEIKKIRMAIVRGKITRDEAKPTLSRLYDESENMASFVNWGRGREVSYPNVVSRNMGGMIPGIQQLMAGARVQPYVRPKKPAGPRVTELEKEVMKRRSELSVARDQGLNDLIFRRDQDGKLNLAPEELLVLLRSNPNVSDKQLKEISKYHSSRIKKGMFGHFDKERGYGVVDRSAGTWRSISSVLDERGYPVVQKRNMGGMIPQMRNIGGPIFDSTKTSKTIVPGVGNKDTVPAALTPGEFVINKDATRKNLDILHAINSGQIQGFAKGGHVIGYEYASAKAITDPRYARLLAKANAGIYSNKEDARSGRNPMDSKAIGREIDKAIAIRKQTTTSSRKFGFGRQNIKNTSDNRGLQSMGGRAMGASMGIGMAGGAMMMAPMMPGVANNPELSSVLSTGGFALSMAAMLPMLGKFGIALGAIAVPLTAATIAFKTMRESIDKVAEQATVAGQNLGGAAGRMEELSAATGYQFSLSKSQGRMFRFTDQQAQDASEFSDYFEGEKGQRFVKELQDLSSEKRYKKVASIIAQGVADGMDPKTAQAYGNAIAAYTNDALLKARLSTDFKKGKFSSGTTALVDLLKEREDAVAKETSSKAVKPVDLGPGGALGNALGQQGSNAAFGNVIIRGGLAGIAGGAIAGAMIGSFAPGIGTAIGFAVGSIVGGIGAWMATSEMRAQIENNTKILSTSFGGSLEVLKEVANAEAAISEARRNNTITEEQATKQLSQVREIEESATTRLKTSISAMISDNIAEPAAMQQGLKNALILNSGFDEGQAQAVVETMNFDSVAQQLFPTKDIKEIKADPAYTQAVVAVMAETLSGITPENAGEKLADIESQFQRIGEAIVEAAKDGMLTATEVRDLVTKESSTEVARSALEAASGKEMTEAEIISDPTLKQEAIDRAVQAGAKTSKVQGPGINREYFVDPETGIEFTEKAIVFGKDTAPNKMSRNLDLRTSPGFPESRSAGRRMDFSEEIPKDYEFKTPIDEASKSFGKLVAESGLVGQEVAELNARFAELSDINLMTNISKSKEEFTRFAGMIRELSKFPGIDIEVMMQTETDQDPTIVAKNIEDTLKRIGDINFKKSFGDNWKEMSTASRMLDPQEFINMSRKIQKAIDPESIFKPEEVTKAYKETLSDLDKLRDNFKESFDKESGVLKEVKVEMIPTVFGEDIKNAQAITDALNDAFPDGFNPILLPIMAQLIMDPKLAAIMQNPGNMANFAEYVNSGGTIDKGYRPEGFTADQMQRAGGQQLFTDLNISTPAIPTGSPFAGQTGSDKSGSGSGQKSLIQQLKDQFKSLQDIYEGYAKNISKKTGMFKGIAAGPFGKQFIDYLISQGDEGIKIFKEKGKKFNQAYEEFVKVQKQLVKNYLKELPEAFNQQRNEIKGRDTLTKNLEGMGFSTGNTESVIEGLGSDTVSEIGRISGKKKKTKKEKEFLAQFKVNPKTGKIPPALKKALVSSQKTDKVSRDSFVTAKEDAFKLEQALSGALGKNIDPEVIDMLIEMGFTAEDAANNVEEISKHAQRLNDVLVQTSFTDEMKDLSTETDNAHRALKLMGQGIPADIANQIANMGNSANFSADQIQDLANTMQHLKILKLALQDPAELRLQQMMGQERINELKYEIDLIESVNANEKIAAEYVKEKVTNHEDLLAVYERQNDAKSREIELRQRDLEPLDEQIEKLEEQKTKIEETYDAQIEALEKVIEKENEIFAIKEKSLDVAGALSRGDVAGAAKAALELEKELSQQRSQDQRQILDQQRKLSIEKIDTRIKNIADQKKVIEEDILKLQKEQRAIQDKIYNAQLIINNEAARLEGIYKLGNNQVDLLKQELILAEKEQRDLNAAVQRQIDLMKELNGIPRNKPSDSESGMDWTDAGGGTDLEPGAVANTNAQTSMNVPIPSAPRPSAPAPAPTPSAPPAPPAPPKITPPPPPPTPTADRLARPQEAALEAQRQAAAAAELRAAQLRSSQIAEQARAAAAAAAAAEATRQRIQAAAAAERAREAAAKRARAEATRAAEQRAAQLRSNQIAEQARAAERARAAQNAAMLRARQAGARAFGGFISKYAMGGRVGYKGSTERAPGMMYGGSAKKYAYGSIVPGRGMTDKVPALLTPGEFVVRKRVAEQYGPLLELINGQVFPTMRTNSFNSSSQAEKSGSMYNYNVNVTLNGSDMDANDVANVVIQKIKMVENKGIRSNNIRG